MATNRKQGKGLVLQWTNTSGADVASGAPVGLGNGLVGIAIHDIANGAAGSVEVPHAMVFDVPVKGHNGTANAPVAAYDRVYHTAGETFFDVDATANFAGWALAPVASGATATVPVLLANA